ncbi:MAG: ATP-binding protein [Pseudomonadota bacterium]
MLKQYLPKSLYARVVLIVILPIFMMQAVVTYAFFERHWDLVSSNLSRATASQVALLTELYDDAKSTEQKDKIMSYANNILDISMRFDDSTGVPSVNKFGVFNLYNELFERRLSEEIRQKYWVDTRSWPSYVEIRVQAREGTLAYFVYRDRVFATTGPIFIAWLIGTSVLLGSIAIVFLRNQVRSILRLADAAEAFGRGRDHQDFKPTGATEVRRAGRAFIAMRERIRRHIDQRTTMLAGVSHDLRTPLTRLKLALALEPTARDIDDMRADINEMERMLDAYLDFASDVTATEPPAPIELCALVREAVAFSDGVQRVKTDTHDTIELEANGDNLKRAISNLIGNSLKYAENVWVTVEKKQGFADIAIDDDGPGIDPADYDKAFKPFERLDQSRNPNTRGVGLGLSIVKDAARRHGGEVLLSKSQHGGLRAVLRLPL